MEIQVKIFDTRGVMIRKALGNVAKSEFIENTGIFHFFNKPLKLSGIDLENSYREAIGSFLTARKITTIHITDDGSGIYRQQKLDKSSTGAMEIVKNYTDSYKLAEATKNQMLNMEKYMRQIQIEIMLLLIGLAIGVLIFYLATQNIISGFSASTAQSEAPLKAAVQQSGTECLTTQLLANKSLTVLNYTITYLSQHTIH